MLEAHAFEILGGLISVLLVINGYFIAGLVKRIDTSNQLAIEATTRVSAMEMELKNVKETMTQLPDIYQRMREMEKELAVLKYINETRES